MRTKALFLCASIALVGLGACQQEATVPNNPTFDPETNSVTTQFVFNVSTGNGAPATKQTAVDVQAGGANFRGMEAVHVLAYDLAYTGVNGASYLWKVSDASSKATRDYDLGAMLVEDEITLEKSRRVLEVALPLETNAILLYGRAPRTKSKNAQGSVAAEGTALNSTLENVTFSLENRLSSEAAFTQFTTVMGRILTGIMNSGRVMESTANGYNAVRDNTYWFWWPIDATSKAWNESPTGGQDEDGNPIPNGNTTYHSGYTMYRGSKLLKEYGDDYKAGTELKPLEEVIGEAYAKIMWLEVDAEDENKVELRAGSSASVLRLTSDLFSVMQRVLSATATSPEEYIAQLVAKETVERASRFYTLSGSGEVVYQPFSIIKNNVLNYIPGLSESDMTLLSDEFFYSASANRPGFPINLGLPMSTALMKFIDPGTGFRVVVYLDETPAYGMSGGSVPVTNYRYPAELMYYTNSSIRVSDDPHEVNEYPQKSSEWVSGTNWDGTTWKENGTVKSTTRSVAVMKNVNYGNALMKSTVSFSEGTIEDNNHGIHTAEPNNEVDVTVPGAIKVTGIIIGGVCDKVGWDFLPKAGEAFDKMIYDNLESDGFVIPPYDENPDVRWSTPRYTLTWDNYNAALADDAQAKVYVALELVNNTGDDLWGELNVIRNGGTFYLVGELNPISATYKPTTLDRADFFYPPFDASGATKNAPRVFMQDYVTSIRFAFTKTSLQHAYVTMPDLRASQVSLGLSVNLEWEKGMEFDVNLGGN